jgi:hypothetical protein
LIGKKLQVNTGLDHVEDSGIKSDRRLVMGIGTGLIDEGIELLDFFHLKL